MSNELSKIMENVRNIVTDCGSSRIRYAVTHGGSVAHMDDMLSSCLLLALGVPVYRRNPTDKEIDDEFVVVFDVGGVADADARCFDHHQSPALECSFIQVIRWLELGHSGNRSITWIDSVDRMGPINATIALIPELSPTQASALPRPLLEAALTGMFASKDEWSPEEGPWAGIGMSLFRWFAEEDRKLVAMDEAMRPWRRRNYTTLKRGGGAAEFIGVDLRGLDLSPNLVASNLRKRLHIDADLPVVCLTDSTRDKHQWVLTSPETNRLVLKPTDKLPTASRHAVWQTFCHANGFVSVWGYEDHDDTMPDDLFRHAACHGMTILE